ncbi:MAG: rod shape-determining protein MreC [Patescibacteria group bacterium]|jgi:rod shape-determining protein MreC
MFKKFRILWLALAIIILGFFLDPKGLLDPAKNGLYRAIRPFSIVGNVTANRTSIFFNELFQLGSLGKENQALIKENLDLQSQIAILKEVQHENEILKNEIGISQSIANTYQISPASIIGRASSGYIKTVVIDRGSKDGVKTGQAVIAQGYLVGVIKQVYQASAEVSLITDYNSIVPVLLQNSRGTGLLQGGLQGLTVEEIPLNITIQTGEQVVTSGLGGDIPAGIAVGKVGNVISKEGEIFQKVTVIYPIQIYYLEFVFVVNP